MQQKHPSHRSAEGVEEREDEPGPGARRPRVDASSPRGTGNWLHLMPLSGVFIFS